jgi:hypothetical protein
MVRRQRAEGGTKCKRERSGNGSAFRLLRKKKKVFAKI